MKQVTLSVAALAMLLGTVSAQAAGPYAHTYASQKNGGPFPTFDCSYTDPCSSLQAAINNTTSPGIVTVTDGEFVEAITISSQVSIEAYEGVSIILRPPASGTAITINGGASDKINITHLLISGLGGGSTGIQFNSGQGLYMRDVTVSGFSGSPGVGINFSPNTAAASGVSQLSIKDSFIHQNTNGNILISPTNSVVTDVKLTGVDLRNSLYGVRADSSAGSGLVRVTATDTETINDNNNGFLAVGTGANPVHFMIDHSTAQNNAAYGAVATGSNAFMILNNSIIVDNATGVAQLNGSTVAMPGNNVVNYNSTNITGTITTLSLH